MKFPNYVGMPGQERRSQAKKMLETPGLMYNLKEFNRMMQLFVKQGRYEKKIDMCQNIHKKKYLKEAFLVGKLYVCVSVDKSTVIFFKFKKACNSIYNVYVFRERGDNRLFITLVLNVL